MSDDTNSGVEEQQVGKEINLSVELPKLLNAGDNLLIPSNSEETLNDLKQSLLIIPITKNLTNYNLFFQNINLTETFDSLTTFGQIIEELNVQVDTELKLIVKEKPYTLAAVYEQISRFREVIGLHYIDRTAEDTAASRGVSVFNNLELSPISEPVSEDNSEETDKDKDKIQISEDNLKILSTVSDEISNISIKANFHPKFDSISDKLKIPIKSLTISQWSPVPSFQQNKGDLLYLTLQSLEGEIFNITCHYSGFFVNRSSSANFNPELKVLEKGKFFKHFILYNLVEQISSLFGKTIEENEVRLSTSSEHPETYLLPQNSTLARPWIVDTKTLTHNPDGSRSQLPLISNGVDGSDYVKDWNEDIQSIRDLPTSTIQERVLRDKLIQKSFHDFTKVATETAINIIKGNLTPMNPNEESERHIYLKNGIFYSSSATTADVYEESGADEAARYVAIKDLAGVKAMNRADISGIHNLVTAVVDYMGKRIICQAPVPGIFTSNVEGEEDEKVVYGLSTDGSKILEDESFEGPLKSIAEVFHLKAHKVEVNEDIKSKGELVVSKDTKGIRGSDGRKYVIDLFRTTPRDITFTEANFDLSREDSYPHGESLIRHEAIAEWWKRKASALFKAETERLEKEGKTLEGKDGEKPQIVLPTDQIVFNPDAFNVAGESKEDQAEVRDISDFIKEHLIKEFLDSFAEQLAPFDGTQLTDLLHRIGINLRYLGYIAEQALVKKNEAIEKNEKVIAENEKEIEKRKAELEAEKAKQEDKKAEAEADKEEKEKEEQEEESKASIEQAVASFDVLYKLSVQEMIARASKHILRKLASSSSPLLLTHLVSHFHNCLLGKAVNSKPVAQIDETLKSFLTEEQYGFVNLTSESVHELVSKEVFSRFRYQLPTGWETSLISSAQLLREIAIKFGIQWKSQDYVFTAEEFEATKDQLAVKSKQIEVGNNKKKGKKSASKTNVIESIIVERDSIFVAEDIVTFVPNVKDSSYRPSLLDEIFQGVRSNLSEEQKELGFSLLNELLSINEQIYGRVHVETSKLYPRVAQIYSDLGDDREAALLARKAIILAERASGFDSFEAINAYMNAGYYESATLNLTNSFKLYQHAINTWTSVFGRDHPALINTLTNLADNLFKVNLINEAAKLFEQALELSIKLNGEFSQVNGIIYYRLASLLLNGGKFKEALEKYGKAEEILNKTLGPYDSLSKQASKYVSSLTTYQEYVKVQEQQKKKQIAEQAAATGNNKVRVKSAAEISSAAAASNGKKSGKKSSPLPDPEIANKSIDDILKFIEGNQPSKSKKNKKSKK
ncbi:accessory factor to EIF3 [Scheffersomyces amazonensis]|uniref:accessory factor to EIF3 n=1 Tax=Scheffersomyces amazonensis TaxID=1078765 RepID=UPI00315CCAEE